MSDDERKSVKEDPALYGKRDPSIEAEEEEESEEEEELEEDIEEDENETSEVEGESVEEEENISTLNGNSSLEEDLTTIEEDGSSVREASPPTVKESPTVEEKHPVVEVAHPVGYVSEKHPVGYVSEKHPVGYVSEKHSAGYVSEKHPVEYSAIIKKYTAFDLNFMEEHSTFGMDSAIMKDDPAIEEEYLAILRAIPPVEEKQAAEEEEANIKSPIEKECQTLEQGVDVLMEKGREPFDIEVTSVQNKQGFYDKGCQTFGDYRPLPIDRGIQTTLRLERSFSTSSLNASMGDDSGNSLKGCPSIEEEPPPEPVEIIKVRAQVMVRNDSTGGWVPEGCGGMSTIIISKIELPQKPGDSSVFHKYTITGTRLSDGKPTLNCTIMQDFEYNKVMPTFHHWKTGDKKYGLTFQSTTEARIFGKGLRDSVFDFMRERDPFATPLKSRGDDDEDYLAFTKPAEPRPRTPSPEVVYDLPDYLMPNAEDDERIQFMQLTNLPEYFYKDYRTNDQRVDEKLRRRPLHRTRKPLKFFGIIRRTSRIRCKYCHELYEVEENGKGQCRYAPDPVKKVIDGLTCMYCAKFCLQDCIFDYDEEYSHPCTCRDDGYCGFRWIGLCLLSCLLPCMFLYPPMKGCYDCGVHCGVCGGRHEEKFVKRVKTEL